MTTTQGRRKHNACLFRLRENCPLRKLRKSKCRDVRPHQTAVEGHWTGFNEQPSGSAAIRNDSAISVIYEPQLSTAHSSSGAHRLDINSDAMETDAVVHPVPSNRVLSAPPPSVLAPGAARNPRVHQRCPSEGSRDACMELDSSVDPETGERAMG